MRDVSSWKRWTDLSRVIDESLADFNRAFAPNATNTIRRMERSLKMVNTESVKAPSALTVAGVISPGVDIPGLVRSAPEGILSRHSSITYIDKDESPTRALSLVLEMIPEKRNGAAIVKGAGRVGDQLGFSQALWLYRNQSDFPQLMTLHGKFCIHFPATVGVRVENGWRFVPCLALSENLWKIYWHWTEDDRGGVTYAARGLDRSVKSVNKQ